MTPHDMAGASAGTIELTDAAGACRIIGGADTPIHQSTLYRGISAGIYPKPIRVGRSSSRWLVRELLAALERAAAARENAA